jgi:septum formation protein
MPAPAAEKTERERYGPRLLLASRSPRRRQLLSEHGFDHEARHPGVEDSSLERGQVTPEEWVVALAYLKAAAGVEAFGCDSVQGPCILLGADTACVKDGRLIGTPRDAADAERILRDLSNGEHDVLTGVALIDPATDERFLFVDSARVWVGELDDAAIDEYIRSKEWVGKAGAYNLVERLMAGWPIQYVGDPSTIMGLPMLSLKRALERMTEVSSAGA